MMPMLPTVPGCVLGVVAVSPALTIQCTRCHQTRTGWPIDVASWAPFPHGHGGERLCPDCREACGCVGCGAS